MGIDVESLIIKPAPLKSNKQTKASFQFSGLVDNDDDNSVTVTFSVPDDEPNVAFIDDGGNKVTSISLSPFDFKVGSSDTYTKQVTVAIAKTDGQPGGCEVNLKAVTSKNDKSETVSSLSYK